MLMSAIVATGCNKSDEADNENDTSFWFAKGANWAYGYNRQTSEYLLYTVEKDTMVEGKRCKIINGLNSKDIVYEENGKVYYYFQNRFRKICDFDVQVGDIVEFEFKTTDAVDAEDGNAVTNTTIVLSFRIDSISSKEIDGFDLKQVFAVYTYAGSDESLNFEYRHEYLEKVGVVTRYNYINEGIFPVCPDQITRPGGRWYYWYKDHSIEYFPDYWVVELKLKPQADPDYLATEDPEIKALELKHDVKLSQTFAGLTNPESLLKYALRGKDGRKRALEDFFATGKFDENYLKESRLAFPGSN